MTTTINLKEAKSDLEAYLEALPEHDVCRTVLARAICDINKVIKHNQVI